MKWRDTAIRLYFKLNGKRCVLCSKPVEVKDAIIVEETQHKIECLMHKKCWRKETQRCACSSQVEQVSSVHT